MADDQVTDADNQSEEGEIKSTPGKEFLTEEVADTADSLDIKPPQTVVKHRKTILHRRERHLEKSSERSRNDKERKSRHHERAEDSRHRDKHSSRHHRQTSTSEKTKRLDPTKRDRESTRHDRKERSTGDRVLEDLRERLLDKRRERREEAHPYKIETSTAMSSTTSSSTRQGREVRVEELRERREMRLAVAAAAVEEAVSGISMSRERRESRYVRVADSQESYSDVEIIETQHTHQEQHHHQQFHHHHHYSHQSTSSSTTRTTTSRDKRHKKSHKREKDREREREKEFGHRTKPIREHHPAMDISVYEELERMEAIAMEQQQHQHRTIKTESEELVEQELRRQRLLEAEREMSRRKETSRLELQARRMRRERGEKRAYSPDQVVELSDESVQFEPSPQRPPRLHRPPPPPVEEVRETVENESSDSSDSSSDDHDEDDDSDDDDDDDDSDDTNDGSAENSEDNERSPRSAVHEESPKHVESNGAPQSTEHNHTSMIEEEEVDLPPYYPAIQGCRSVEEYKCLNRIAEGTYGVVYRAEDRRTKEIVALKRLKMEKEKDGFPITSLREINTLLKAQHPNIVTVREIVVGSNMDKIFIVMDYVEHDLKSLMETMKTKNQMFTTGEIKCLMQQLLRAVAHLHDNWILHRDLKTSNLLLSHRGILKVGDFGLAREYGSPLKQYTSIVVTLYYRAPELLLGSKQYSTPVDVWSVGCIFAELLRMEPFFPGQSEIDLLNKIFKELGSPSDKIWPGYSKLPMVKKIPFAHYPVNNLKQRFNLTLSDLGIELLTKFLTYDPAQRITAEEASKHKYFMEAPMPIDPAMFPTWPAKSEFGLRAAMPSPKILNDGKELKQCANKDEDEEDDPLGFHMGSRETSRQLAVGGGFHLKF